MHNFNSIKSEFQQDKLESHLKKSKIKPHYVCLPEVNSHDVETLNLNGYILKAHSFKVQQLNGQIFRGGVSIFERKNMHIFQSTEVHVQATNQNFDVCAITFTIGVIKYIMVLIYRNPKANVEQFNYAYQELIEHLEKLFPGAVILIMGDFNLHHTLISPYYEKHDKCADLKHF